MFVKENPDRKKNRFYLAARSFSSMLYNALQIFNSHIIPCFKYVNFKDMILHCVLHFFIRHGVLHYSVWKVHYFLEVSLFVGVCLFKIFYSLSIISHCLRFPHGLLDLSWFADFIILLHENIIVYYFCWIVCTFYNVVEDVTDVLSFPKPRNPTI